MSYCTLRQKQDYAIIVNSNMDYYKNNDYAEGWRNDYLCARRELLSAGVTACHNMRRYK